VNQRTTQPVEANGLRFVVETHGDDGPLVLLLHGFPDTAASMEPLGAMLAEAGFFTAAPHLRGYAETGAAPDGRYDLEALAEDALALIEAFGQQSAIIIGHDWGAVIAYVAAALAPDKVDHVFALSVPPLPVFFRSVLRSPSQLWRSRYIFFFQLPFLPERRLVAQNAKAVERLWRRWSFGPLVPGHLERARTAFSSVRVAASALMYYRTMFRLHRRAARRSLVLAYRSLTVPTRVMVGEKDGCIAPVVFRGCPYPVDVIPDVGHFLPSEAPDIVARLVIETLQRSTDDLKR
jgi:pimeloyl-ACP methyl ester carboxylesterase